jgi:hypothetical protein
MKIIGVVTTVEEGAKWIYSSIIQKSLIIDIKGSEFIKEAMMHYRDTQYSKDEPMQLLTQNNRKIYDLMYQQSEGHRQVV